VSPFILTLEAQFPPMKTKLIVAVVALALTAVAFTMNNKTEHVRHVVVFKYKKEATPAQIKEVTDAFRDLKNKIPGIVSFEHGQNISPEKLDQGFSHVYLLTFENAAARDKYLPHPDHSKFGELLGKVNILDGKPFVVDFRIEE
jgi:hypothetical protein